MGSRKKEVVEIGIGQTDVIRHEERDCNGEGQEKDVLKRWIAEAYGLANPEEDNNEQDNLEEPSQKRRGYRIPGDHPKKSCGKDIGKAEGNDGESPSGKRKAVAQNVGRNVH